MSRSPAGSGQSHCAVHRLHADRHRNRHDSWQAFQNPATVTTDDRHEQVGEAESTTIPDTSRIAAISRIRIGQPPGELSICRISGVVTSPPWRAGR